MINDITAGRDPNVISAVKRRCGLRADAHAGVPSDHAESSPVYTDVVAEVSGIFTAERFQRCQNAGIDADRLRVDPGFGFGKSLEHNLTLLRNLPVSGFKVVRFWLAYRASR